MKLKSANLTNDINISNLVVRLNEILFLWTTVMSNVIYIRKVYKVSKFVLHCLYISYCHYHLFILSLSGYNWSYFLLLLPLDVLAVYDCLYIYSINVRNNKQLLIELNFVVINILVRTVITHKYVYRCGSNFWSRVQVLRGSSQWWNSKSSSSHRSYLQGKRSRVEKGV